MRDGIELSRRNVLAGLGTIGVASAGVGFGTSAYFSDEETYENNRFVAGELDLNVGWEEHYSDWSDDESDGLEGGVQMEQGEGFTAGSTVNSTRVGLPSNAAAMISLADAADAKQVLDNTQEDVYPEGYDSDDFMTGTSIACDDTLLGDDDTDKPVIELDDVKPGDFGEVTFSFALCDNPGYVWAQAFLENASENGMTEPEGKDPDEEEGVVELLDEIMVAVWLDDGNNYQNCGEQPLTVGSLREVITGIPNPGLRLDGRNVALADASPTDFTAFGVNRFENGDDYALDFELTEDPADGSSGKVAHGTSDGEPTKDYATTAVCVDETVEDIDTLSYQYYEGSENTNTIPDEVYLLLEEGPNGPNTEGTQHVVFRTAALGTAADGQIEDSWQTREVALNGQGPDTTTFNWTEIGGSIDDPPETEYPDATVLSMAVGLGNLAGDEDGAGTSDIYYQKPRVETGTEEIDLGPFPTSCFRGEGTVYNGVFAWWLPVDHGNEIQTDTATFTLGLYTEQCRHNDGSGMEN